MSAVVWFCIINSSKHNFFYICMFLLNLVLPWPGCLKDKSSFCKVMSCSSSGITSYQVQVVKWSYFVLRRRQCNSIFSTGLVCQLASCALPTSSQTQGISVFGKHFRTANQWLCFRVIGMSQRVNGHQKPNGCLLWDESEIYFYFISVMLRVLFILLVF